MNLAALRIRFLQMITFTVLLFYVPLLPPSLLLNVPFRQEENGAFLRSIIG